MSIKTWPSEYAGAGGLLRRAATYAEALNHSEWNFAVEIQELQEYGLTRVDLRRLVCEGLIEHADEIATHSCEHRTFLPCAKLAFSTHSCFVLTALGRAAVEGMKSLQYEAPRHRIEQSERISSRHKGNEALSRAVRPIWQVGMNRLFLGDLLVKHFRRPAPNQYLILGAFQEENWPHRIDDPLPMSADIPPSRRLHETIAGLNRCQNNCVLRFASDGQGKGIIWSALL